MDPFAAPTTVGVIPPAPTFNTSPPISTGPILAAGLGVPNVTSGLQSFALGILFGFPSLALIIVTVRAAGRWASRQFGWDDGLICVAMFMSVIETVASYKFIKTNYIGIRGDDIPNHDPFEGMVWNYAVQILYNPILALVKCSVLIFLYRLFGQKRGVKAYVYGLTTINLLQMVAVFFAIVFQCFPISMHWDPTVEGRCVNQPLLYITTASFTILTDFAVLALPAYIFRDLKIPRKTKFALMGVFLLGGLVTAASIARLLILVVGLYGLVEDPDPSYNIGFITSAIETNLALITASAPALMPLLKSWFPNVFGADVVEGATTREQRTRLKSINNKSGRNDMRGWSPRESEEDASMNFSSISPKGRYEGV